MAVYTPPQKTSAYGNVNMYIRIYRGEVTRTKGRAEFKFGVSFSPVSQWTTNSIAAIFGGETRFATTNPGYDKEDSRSLPCRAEVGERYYAHYTDRGSARRRTSESLCYTCVRTGLNDSTTKVNINIGVGWSDWAGTNKGSLTFEVAIPEYRGNVKKGTVSIVDNGDNKFTISGTKGADGDNNPSTGFNIKWSYDSAAYETAVSSGSTINLKPSSGNTRTVYAQCTTTAAHGPPALASSSRVISYYKAPSLISAPAFFYSKSRFTIKEPWLVRWLPGIAGNSISPIKGYRIKLYKNNSLIDIYNNSRVKLSNQSKIYDRESAATSITLSPTAHNFKVGDTAQVSIQPYTRYKDSGSTLLLGNEIRSIVHTVKNTGIFRVKVGGSWKEGEVWVKAEGSWKEAEEVLVKAGGLWKEAD